MPTISQLPLAETLNAADQIPVSQDGVSRTTSVGSLLSDVQPAIHVTTNTLLGRTSLGAGSPEEIAIGPGLILENGTLTTAAGLLNAFQTADNLTSEDRLVIRRNGELNIVPASAARALYTAGQHVAIDNNGTIQAIWPSAVEIGAGGTIDLAALPRTQALQVTDLIPISRAGVNQATSYGTLLNAQTVDQAAPANAADDADLIWVAQGGNVMTRQTFGAIWQWIATKLPSARLTCVEIEIDTTLDATVHNGRTLVCTQPVHISHSMQNMGPGFRCEIINLSAAPVTFSSAMVLPFGVTSLAPRKSAHVCVLPLSSGNIIFVNIATPGATVAVPGPVQNLSISDLGTNSVRLDWVEPVIGAPPFTYTVLHRQAGSTSWVSGPSAFGEATRSVTGLTSGTAYEFVIVAANTAGSGNMSAVVSVTMQGAVSVPGQPINLAAATQGPDSVALSWSPPTSGGPVTGYNIQYRSSGASVWTNGATNLAAIETVVSGLNASTSYDFRVFASNTDGVGPASAVTTATTQPVAGAVTSIQWNMAPTGPYAHGAGAIGVNVLVTPADAAVRFGFSTSSSIPPTTWTLGVHVMTNLWGAYVDTPATAGAWYAWAQGTDGSATTLHPTSFTVQ